MDWLTLIKVDKLWFTHIVNSVYVFSELLNLIAELRSIDQNGCHCHKLEAKDYGCKENKQFYDYQQHEGLYNHYNFTIINIPDKMRFHSQNTRQVICAKTWPGE